MSADRLRRLELWEPTSALKGLPPLPLTQLWHLTYLYFPGRMQHKCFCCEVSSCVFVGATCVTASAPSLLIICSISLSCPSVVGESRAVV